MTTRTLSLKTKLEKKIHTQETLLEFSKALSLATDLKQVYNIIMLTCMGHRGIVVTAFLEGRKAGDAFELVAVKGIDMPIENKLCNLSKALLEELFNDKNHLTKSQFLRESAQCQQILESIECHLMIPIFYHDDIIGLLLCGTKVSERAYSDEDIAFLTLIAGHAGVAINNIKAMDACKINNKKLEMRLFELETIEDINRAMASALDLGDVCKTMLLSITGYLTCESAALFLLESNDSLNMQFITSVGSFDESMCEDIKLENNILRALEQKSYLYVSDYLAACDFETLQNKNSMEIAIPIKNVTEVVAVALFSKKATGKEFRKRELKLAAMLANQAVAPIRKSQLYSHLKESNQALTNAMDKARKEVAVRRKAEEMVRRNEQRFRTLLMTANDGFWEFDPQEKTLDVNPKLCDILGYSRKELIDSHLYDFIEQADTKLLNEQVRIRKEGHKSIYELTLLHKNGQQVHCLMKSSPLFKDDKFSGSFSMVTDITERKKLENELRKYEHIVSSSNDAMAMVDQDHLFLQANDACAAAFDAKRNEMIGKGVEELLSGLTIGKVIQSSVDQSLEGEDVHYRAWFDLPRFGRRYLDAAFYPFYKKHGDVQGVIFNLRDITHEKRLEEYLVHAQKMEAIGTLASGIAHDFNNILTAIFGFAELAQGSGNDDQRKQRHLSRIIQAGQRARDLVRQILTFSRQAKQHAQPIQLSSIVKEVVKMLQASLPFNIAIQQDISDVSDIVFADPVQIHQVLLNLCTNAVHAMESTGGVMQVTLDTVEIDAHAVKQQPDLNVGSYLKLSISDTGPGMDDKIVARIFEPFFSTKPLGNGSGLGLATSHGIIKDHGGVIIVDSIPGQGSTFHVFIPVLEGAEIDAAQPGGAADLPIGSERILYVDDEPFILEMAAESLEGLGYCVTAEGDARKAFKLFESDPEQFDIVITDLAMPSITGLELAQDILSLRPDMPILLCSGYSEKISQEKMKLIGIRGFVMKPFVLIEMAGKIRKALGNP